MPGVRLLAAVVGAVLIVLMPLAHSSPIDPSTPGFWDDGDFDDVIIFLTSHLHFLEIDTLPLLAVCHVVVWDVAEHLIRTVAGVWYEPGSARAPPAA